MSTGGVTPTPDERFEIIEAGYEALSARHEKVAKEVETLKEQPIPAPRWLTFLLAGLIIVSLITSIGSFLRSQSNGDQNNCHTALLLIERDLRTALDEQDIAAGCNSSGSAFEIRDAILRAHDSP